MIRQINKLAEDLYQQTGKVLIGVRVFDNCLLCYFQNNSCRFISKENKYWGEVGSFYLPTVTYSRANVTSRIQEQFPGVIKWMEDYLESNKITRWLMRFNKRQSYDY